MPRLRPDRPNVVVFFTDQQRWDSVGLHGNPLDLTPNLDRLARRGTHAPNAFTPQPVCAPARACLQTGLYPTTSGIYRNHLPLSAGTPTLAHHFGAAGYRTGYIGKWHLAGRDPVPPEQRGGYQSWLAANLLELRSDAYQTVLYDEREQPVQLPGYRADALGDAAIRFLDAHQDEPFFLFVSFLEPHHQNHREDYPAPDGYAERYTGRWTPPDLAALGGNAAQHLGGYWGMVRRLDEVLGRLLDALKSLGLLEDTIVVFASDHGCHFRTRNSEHKRSCHDASIRVPLALQGPGFDGGGQLREHHASTRRVEGTGLAFCPARRGPDSWPGRPDGCPARAMEAVPMNRAGLIVVVLALLLAVGSTWRPGEARAQSRSDRLGSTVLAALIDASVKNVPILSHAAGGQQPLGAILSNRDVLVVEIDKLVDGDEATLLGDVLSGSDVLRQNVMLVRGAAATDGALGALLAAHDVPVDRVVAVDLSDDTSKLVTVYVFRR
jgi:hypothetical protein